MNAIIKISKLAKLAWVLSFATLVEQNVAFADTLPSLPEYEIRSLDSQQDSKPLRVSFLLGNCSGLLSPQILGVFTDKLISSEELTQKNRQLETQGIRVKLIVTSNPEEEAEIKLASSPLTCPSEFTQSNLGSDRKADAALEQQMKFIEGVVRL